MGWESDCGAVSGLRLWIWILKDICLPNHSTCKAKSPMRSSPIQSCLWCAGKSARLSVAGGGGKRKSLWLVFILNSFILRKVKFSALQKQEVKQEVGFQEILGFDRFPHSIMVFISGQVYYGIINFRWENTAFMLHHNSSLSCVFFLVVYSVFK